MGAVLLTRATPEQAAAVAEVVPGAVFHERSGLVVVKAAEHHVDATVVVVAAGTSDLPVAEEAAVALEAAGVRVERITDVGVAGVHRVLAHRADLEAADCCVVVAGMEGALPSVVAGLTSTPVVAVPTSVGYGASFEGLAALLSMLSSCAPGVSVVNIDNGFGAAQVAFRIVRAGPRRTTPTARARPDAAPLLRLHLRDLGGHDAGALIQAGADPDVIREHVAALPLEPFEFLVEEVETHGIHALQVTVRAEATAVVRTYANIRAMLEEADLPAGGAGDRTTDLPPPRRGRGRRAPSRRRAGGLPRGGRGGFHRGHHRRGRGAGRAQDRPRVRVRRSPPAWA